MSTLIWISLLLGASASVAALWGHYRELPGWLTGPEVCQLVRIDLHETSP